MAELVERYWTAEDVRALPEDGKRYECIDGVLLVTPAPAPPHQVAFRWLFAALSAYVELCQCGDLFSAPADVEIVPGTIVQPDVFVSRTATGKALRSWRDITELILAVEIISPSTAKTDRHLKRRFYQRAGVDEYWIVDLTARRIERWTPLATEPEILSRSVDWAPVARAAAFRLDLPTFFSKVLGD